MATIKSVPRKRRLPSMKDGLVFDVTRGTLRVRRWPRKRPGTMPAEQAFWVDWFKQANRLTKYVDGASTIRAMQITKNTGMYPRDILLKAMRGRYVTWKDQFGWIWSSMAARGDISQSLDILAQTVGNVLVRGATYWLAAANEGLGNVLTSMGPGNPAQWVAPVTGQTQIEAPGSPIFPDNTKSTYTILIDKFLDAHIQLEAVTLNAADTIKVRFSNDGGVTWFSAVDDYLNIALTSTVEQCQTAAEFGISNGSIEFVNTVGMFFGHLQSDRLYMEGMCGDLSGGSARARYGIARFSGPVNAIQIFTGTGTNFKSGLIRVLGAKNSVDV